jgi:hypothetical protein
MAMEFYVASAPEDHPVVSAQAAFVQGSLGPAWQGEERRLSRNLFLCGRARADSHGCDLRQITHGEPFGGRSERPGKTSITDQESNKGRTINRGRAQFELSIQEADQARNSAGTECRRNPRPRKRRCETANSTCCSSGRDRRQAHSDQGANVASAVCAGLLHQSENATGMGARTEKPRRNHPRIPRGHREEP